MISNLLRHLKMRRAQKALKADHYGNNMGPFLIAPMPPGEFGKDWSTDARDIWIRGGYVVMYYGNNDVSRHIPRPSDTEPGAA